MCFGGGDRYSFRAFDSGSYLYEGRQQRGRFRRGLGRSTYYPPRYYARPPAGPFVGHGPVHRQQAMHHPRRVYSPQGRACMPRQCARFSPPCQPAAVIQNPIVYPAVAAATTYTIANAVPVTPVAANPVVVSPQPAQPAVVRTRDDIQLENRRLATQRGAYDPKRIKPADARPDDAFWCREKNGEYHLRTYYQIENECYPGRWLMDAKRGYLVFYRH